MAFNTLDNVEFLDKGKKYTLMIASIRSDLPVRETSAVALGDHVRLAGWARLEELDAVNNWLDVYKKALELACGKIAKKLRSM